MKIPETSSPRSLLALFALAAVVSMTGCTLFAPTDKTIDKAMTPAQEGEVVRDQYGVYVLKAKPTLYERNTAVLRSIAGN